jgi:2-C-methyl-D-erythritol 4-phosphate cytidylyltransferase/2-C-methyl-D-erythritol 2,4-cyclodiphosphate synthase
MYWASTSHLADDKAARRMTGPEKRSVAVVIVAAGRGERAGHLTDGPKQYRKIGGRAVISHTLEAFATHPGVDRVVVAIHPEDEDLFPGVVDGIPGKITAVTGGPTRQASTRLGLLALQPHRPDAVLIHDAVRPFADHELIARVIDAITEEAGVLPALPVSDTLKQSSGTGTVGGTVARDGLHAAQTPQGFPFAAILEAHERAASAGREDFTDDAAIAEWVGMPVKLVAGSPENTKLTWARDIAMANERLSQATSFPDVRAGSGYDVHCFEPGEHVTLCGVGIPHDRKLAGHSDADVGLHALTDALLATCGQGDIGSHFPPSDPQWKGAASRIFVEHAADIVRARGGRIASADITLICEAPKIAPHRDEMTRMLADMLRISRDRISVKATTNERLGFIGRGEGIAAIATATVIYPGMVPE